jgi:hypothetical protein
MLDWWKEFIDKHIVPYLASWFWCMVIILPHPEYDMFHGLITKWTPMLSLHPLNQALNVFINNCVDGLNHWWMHNSLKHEEAIAWHREWL